jgi:glycosyltransferase involved in cell wall biosynthesis
MSVSASQRHCMVVHNYYPIGEPRVERQAQALVACGYEVDVVCLRNQGEAATEAAGGITIYRLPLARRRGSGRARQLLEYLTFFVLVLFKLPLLQRSRRYQTIQTHNLPDFLVFASLGARLQGTKLLLDIHDLMPEFYASSFGGRMNSWPIRLLTWQERLACRFVHHVITVTPQWQQTLIDRGVPRAKTSVVMNVADNRIFHPLPAPAKENNDFHLIYHGTLARRYGVDLPIRALALLRDELPYLHLTIHGRGDYLPELIALAEVLGVQSKVRFSTEYMPITELPHFIRHADVGIVPNRRDIFTDGILPTKLMEYVALGIPAIAARTPAIENYFDETMVSFFQPDDAAELANRIRALSADRDALIQLGHNANRFNHQYNWQVAAAGYVSLIEQLWNGAAHLGEKRPAMKKV